MSKVINWFNTKNTIILATLVLTALLMIAGVYAPESMLMSFANVSLADTIVRSLTMLGLIVILTTKPPRPMMLRYALGSISSIVLILACVSMVDYHIGMLDAALYFLAAIVLAMEAIEEHHQPVQFAQSKKIRSES